MIKIYDENKKLVKILAGDDTEMALRNYPLGYTAVVFKDYCSGSPESINGIDLSKCCKLHDNMVGEAGTYNPITPHIEFYKCLKNTGIGLGYVWLYTIGGAVFSLYKYPYLAYKKYKWRKNNGR